MDLKSFPRPADGSRRGIHWSASVFHPSGSSLDWWINELLAMNIKWVKLLDNGGGSSKSICQKLLANQIIPIVRLYRDRPNPLQLNDEQKQTVKDLVALGVRYVECTNEPNLESEWQVGAWQSGGNPELVMQNWVPDAKAVIAAGGYPAFPALAQCGLQPEHGSINWTVNAFEWLDEQAHADAEYIFTHGGWIAVHAATLNHCYKDSDGNWHFEYPYDPICQKDQPGKTILQDDNSLIGYRMPAKLLQDHFGLQVPVISTEGGVLVPQSGWEQLDSRYPGYDEVGHAERTVAMFQWLRTNAEDYFFAMCPWLIANERMGFVNPAWTKQAWYQTDRELPVVNAVKRMGSEPAPLPTLPLDETLRNATWKQRHFPYNPTAALTKYARSHNLGSPLTEEFDITWGGKSYRVQGFTVAIVYAEVGDWGNIESLSW